MTTNSQTKRTQSNTTRSGREAKEKKAMKRIFILSVLVALAAACDVPQNSPVLTKVVLEAQRHADDTLASGEAEPKTDVVYDGFKNGNLEAGIPATKVSDTVTLTAGTSQSIELGAGNLTLVCANTTSGWHCEGLIGSVTTTSKMDKKVIFYLVRDTVSEDLDRSNLDTATLNEAVKNEKAVCDAAKKSLDAFVADPTTSTRDALNTAYGLCEAAIIATEGSISFLKGQISIAHPGNPGLAAANLAVADAQAQVDKDRGLLAQIRDALRDTVINPVVTPNLDHSTCDAKTGTMSSKCGDSLTVAIDAYTDNPTDASKLALTNAIADCDTARRNAETACENLQSEIDKVTGDAGSNAALEAAKASVAAWSTADGNAGRALAAANGALTTISQQTAPSAKLTAVVTAFDSNGGPALNVSCELGTGLTGATKYTCVTSASTPICVFTVPAPANTEGLSYGLKCTRAGARPANTVVDLVAGQELETHLFLSQASQVQENDLVPQGPVNQAKGSVLHTSGSFLRYNAQLVKVVIPDSETTLVIESGTSVSVPSGTLDLAAGQTVGISKVKRCWTRGTSDPSDDKCQTFDDTVF